MKKHIGISLFFMGCFLSLSATNYFVATNGDDSNAGTLDKPFATLQKAQSKVVPGDTVYIRGGEYRIREEQMMGGDHLRAYVFEMNKSGTQAKRICYTGYQDERPIFNLTEVKSEGKRVSVFYVSGSYLHFRNFEIIKTQVTIRYNPQIQISAESETKRSIFREKDKTKRSKKESAQHSKSRNKSFVMTSVSAL